MQINKNKFSYQMFVLGIILEIIFMFFNSNIYFQLSGWYFPLLISIIFGTILSIERLNKVNTISIIAILLILLLGISLIVNVKMFNRGYFISYLLSFILLFQVTEIELSKESINKIAIAYAISGIVISSMMMIFRVRYYVLTETRLTIAFMSNTKIDPNYLGGFLASAATISLLFIEKNEKKIIKFLLIIGTILTSFGTILTGSRGALITLLACVFLYIFYTNRKHRIVRIFIPLMIVFIIFVLFSNLVSSETIERFSNISKWAQDGSNIRRLSLWSNAWKSISKSPILGFGLTGTAEINSSIGNFGEPAHCTYLEMWCQLGIVILILLTVLLTEIVKYKNKAAIIILISTLVPAMFISAECTFYFFFNIAFSAAICRTDILYHQE